MASARRVKSPSQARRRLVRQPCATRPQPCVRCRSHGTAARTELTLTGSVTARRVRGRWRAWARRSPATRRTRCQRPQGRFFARRASGWSSSASSSWFSTAARQMGRPPGRPPSSLRPNARRAPMRPSHPFDPGDLTVAPASRSTPHAPSPARRTQLFPLRQLPARRAIRRAWHPAPQPLPELPLVASRRRPAG